MTARIYDRPDLDQARHVPGLYVDGTLPNAKPSVAYEGRLQIHNAIGACTVEQIDGDTLPNGASLYVDNDASEVVIAWPAYSSTTAPIFNGNFELGDVGWIKGAGWTVDHTADHHDVQHENRFGNYNATFRGYGTSYLESAAYTKLDTHAAFAGQGNIQQGGSSANATGAAFGVRFYGADKALIAEQLAPFIGDGRNGNWHYSSGTFTPPANAQYARAVFMGKRVRQNMPAWVDDASWGLQAVTGINVETSIDLTLRVADSAGRDYVWSGSIRILVWDGSWGIIPYASLGFRGVPNAIYFGGKARLLIGGHDGHVWRSDDRGATWTDTSSPLNSTAYYTRSFDYNDRDGVLVCCGHYVARSLDGGATWSRTYTPYDSAWQCVRWIPQWDIFIVVGAGAYTRRILTLNAAGAAPSNKSNTGNYYNIAFVPQFGGKAICLPNNSPSYAITSDPTATAWTFKTAPSNINGKYGFAVLPNGDFWVSTYSGYMVSKDGGETFGPEIIAGSLPGVQPDFNRGGLIAYNDELNVLLITPFGAGTGPTSARQYISKDYGSTFQAAEVANPWASVGITTPSPEGVVFSKSAGCFVVSDSDTSPTISYSRTGKFT